MSDEPLQPSQEAQRAANELLLGPPVPGGDGGTYVLCSPTITQAAQAFARFEALIRADQRERDAKIVEDIGRGYLHGEKGFLFKNAQILSAAIRKEAP